MSGTSPAKPEAAQRNREVETMQPKLSIVVPVYNVEKVIRKALDSLAGQTLEDIEILLVNDGSTDHSEEICREYAEKDSRIRLFSKPNGGLSDARNYGMERASADVIGFVDSDDYVDLDMFECLLRIKNEHGAQIAVGGVRMATYEEEVYLDRAIDGEKVFNTHDAMAELLYSKRILNSVCNKIFDRSLFDGITFPFGKLYEDEYVTYRLFDRAEKVAMTDRVFYYYRSNPKSITHKAFSERELNRVYASLLKLDFIQERYPDLRYLVEEYLVYDCMMTMSKMERYDSRYDKLLRDNIRAYWRSFVKGDHSITAKMYVCLARMSPRLAVLCGRIIRQ